MVTPNVIHQNVTIVVYQCTITNNFTLNWPTKSRGGRDSFSGCSLDVPLQESTLAVSLQR